MEVDRKKFYHELIGIIEAISSCDALSIDLEMSGISTNMTGNRVQMTLSQVYAKAKEVAEAFTILQVGLKSVSWDKQAQEYVTKTFNILLSPSVTGFDQVSVELARKVERKVGFSFQTINFLQDNEFNFHRVFELGVPYLSIAETGQPTVTKWLKDRGAEYHDRNNIRQLKEETQDFCRLIRSGIQDWITAKIFGEERSQILTLTSPYDGRFNAFQKRLGHQIIETEFFEYRVCSKNGSMSMEVSRINPSEEKKNGRILAWRSQALVKLTGSRYVWDAITGENFANKIDSEIIIGRIPELIISLRERLLASETQLREKRPILIGYNMLYDLCFLFQTFTGTLPDTSKCFQDLIRKKMPYIVDTKYMVTRGHRGMCI